MSTMMQRIDPKDHILWVEKYRPQRVADCILPAATAAVLNGIVKSGEVPNIMMSGSSGIGKTTAALAICDELGISAYMVNGSMDGGIDTLRTTIRQYASTQSFDGTRKVVILDEADRITEATQQALRNFMEEFASTTSFIFTANLPARIIPALHSRCATVRFDVGKEEKAKMLPAIAKRIKEILKAEGAQIDNEALVEVVYRYFPDIRRMLGELQNAARAGGGTINGQALLSVTDSQIRDLIKTVKGKDFGAMRKWVAENNDMDPNVLFQRLYQNLELFTPQSRPEVVLILADAQYRSAFVASQEINLVAMLAELMAKCDLR